MIIKLNDEKSPLGKKFDRKATRKMVRTYRKLNENKDVLHYAHFAVEEILQMLMDNKILKTYELNTVKTHGIKMYLGTHINESIPNERYRDKTTPILCCTKIENDSERKYVDLLQDNTDSVLLPLGEYLKDDGNYALDQSVICPPDCPVCEIDPQTNQCKYDVALDQLT